MDTHKTGETRHLTREEILGRIRHDLLAAREDVVGIIVFGSFARGESWRDVDVLAVLESLDSEKSAWVAAATALSNAIQLDTAVEVFPYSRRGLLRGLRNHGPFLLDVATDGLLLHDQANLGEALAETRRYIEERGIRRTGPGGWQYPVRYRRNTPLSESGNEDFVRRWLEDAERDAEAAQALRERGLHDRSVYHCQQAVERAVKAVLGCSGLFERTHFVARVLRQQIGGGKFGEWNTRLSLLADIAGDLERHASRSRYIIEGRDGEELWVPSEHYFEADSRDALQQTRQALVTAREFVDWWFAPEAEQS